MKMTSNAAKHLPFIGARNLLNHQYCTTYATFDWSAQKTELYPSFPATSYKPRF